MIPIFVLLFSGVALVQFFVSYSRSILTAYAKVELSAKTREVAGLETDRIPGGQFACLLGLLRIARSPGDDRMELLAVRLYYLAIRVLGAVAAPFNAAAKTWSENEGARCAYVAAVALDRRIALLSQ